jgi:hypothetical protein
MADRRRKGSGRDVREADDASGVWGDKEEDFWATVYRRLVERARSGKDPGAAYELIREFATKAKAGGKLHPVLLAYISDALMRTWGKEDPMRALNLLHPAHRLAGERDDQQLKLAAAYELENRGQPKKRSGSIDSAVADKIGHRFGASTKTIRRAVKANPEVAALTNQELQALIAKQ